MNISIIIPVHNSEEFLVGCLKSVIHQISSDNEIILIENGSHDNTPALCAKYAQEYDCIKYIELGPVGVSAARNEGIKAAKGKWVTFVDSDDTLLDGALDVLKNPECADADIIIAGYSRDPECADAVGAINRVRSELMAKGVLQFAKYKKEITAKALVDDYNNWSSLGKFFKRSFLINNNISFPVGVRLSEDTAFCFQAYCAADKVYAIKQRIYFYRYNENSVVRTYDGSLLDNNKLLVDNFATYIERFPKTKAWRKEYAALCAVKLIDICLCIFKTDLKNEKRKKSEMIKDICSEKIFSWSIMNAPIYQLINGRRNNILYATILCVLRIINKINS